MKLDELSIADLSAIIGMLSKEQDRLPRKGLATAEETKQWENLAFKKGCLISARQRKMDKIEWPTPSK